jgi:5-methylthioadenosine/S-adenosylhomocysteine deaminase
MRTRINGSWIVGWDGRQHQVIRDGVCVLEDDRVLHVGKSWDGQADQTVDARGKLVSPGLICTHRHAGINATDYIFLDRGRPDSMARNYLNWHAGVKGRPRYEPPLRLRVLWGLGQCLQAGQTTVLEFAAQGEPEEFVHYASELGIRVYTGPGHRNALIFARDDGSIEYEWDDERGTKALKRALDFAARFDGHAGGRIKAMLCAGHPDTCTLELLQETASQGRQNKLPITIHAAIHGLEMERVLETYRLTPIQLLDKARLLGTDVILDHVLFISGHSWTRYPDAPDLQLLGEAHATVSHSPLKYFHMGVHLESLRRYVEAGVNMTIGADFPPGDILAEMRYTMLLSRVADRSFLSGTPRDVFDAATVNAAKALGRDDLGRLAPGAKADVVLFDMRKMHFGAIHDPVKSLVETGSASDVDTVYVDGKVVVRDGRLATVNQRELIEECQREGEQAWTDVPNWAWGRRSIEDMVPPAYPMF